MSVQAFVDESRRGRHLYLICAALISPTDLQSTRKALREMLLPRQRRLHFASEGAQRRQSLLAAMSKLPVRTRLYISTEKEPVARHRALEDLLNDLRNLNGKRLVIECREANQDDTERRRIAEAVRQGAAPSDLTYSHLRAHQEPMLWVPDAVAWAYGAGREWRRRTQALIDRVQNVDTRR